MFLTESWKLMLNFSTFPVGNCWGQPMLLFQKLVDETQMLKPREYTDIFFLTKKLFLVGLSFIGHFLNFFTCICLPDLKT